MTASSDPVAGPLIAPERLADVIAMRDSYHPALTILDVRWRLGGPSGRADYLAGHLPGAVFLELDEELCGPPHTGTGGRHPLPDVSGLQAVLRRAGLTDGGAVVVYDGGDGMAAARTWWTLRWAGVPEVAVLDGGFPAWRAAGGPVSAEVPEPVPGDVVLRPGQLPMLDADAAAKLVAAGGVLLDVRTPERYRGEQEPIDPVAGHIPGAVNAPKAQTHGPDGRLLPPAELRAYFAGRGVAAGRAVGAYCGSGVTAAHTALALTVAGFEPALYVGSWSDWISDPERPVATGP